MDVRAGPKRKLNTKELMLLNCDVGESLLDCKEVKPVTPRGNLSWMFIERTDAEVEASILWPPDVKSQLTGKDSDDGKFEGRSRKGWQRMRWLYGIIDSMDTNLSKLKEIVKAREAWHVAIHGVTKSRTWLSNWTTATRDWLINSLYWLMCLWSLATPKSAEPEPMY